MARSRFFTEKYEDCLQYLSEALNLYPESPKLLDLNERCKASARIEMQRMQQVTLINKGKDSEKMTIYRNLRSKKIKLGKAMHDLPAMVDQSITQDKRNKLHFPVLILYEEFMTTDFIQDWQEDETFRDALRPMFKEQAPWDREGIYRLDCIEVYFEAEMTKPLDPKEKAKTQSTKKHIKVDMKSKLIDVIQHPNYIVP